MLKKIEDCEDKEPIFIVKVKQPYPRGMRYWYVDGVLITKEATRQRCLQVCDNYCKEKLHWPRVTEEDRMRSKIKKFYRC